ncbi:IucA/IucC family C-terminal-domain containing protein [Marinomonas sp. FW-1]|uniref:IucA/IucC family C-terminal-domain containing protein n=1 Tax=Marinomonas sp. FW-1 TaxID=2071621 RepID=UPI0010BF6E1B|nr:IucA/IucC family C-terminal-domain containing protein [Marinomonas sp. FW-1]
MDAYLSSFTEEQWQSLSSFGLTPFMQSEVLAIPSSMFLDDQQCLMILEKIMPVIKAPNIKVTVSLILKRVAFLTLAPVLFAMSRYDKGLNVKEGNSVFHFAQEDGHWRSSVALKKLSVSQPDGNRVAWREKLLHNAFAGHLTLLVEQFHRLTRTPKNILWENIAIRVFSIYESRILLGVPEERKTVAQEDFSLLLDPNTTELFGLPKNPIADFYFEMSQVPYIEEPVRIRQTCCYYYQTTDPADYCGACPLPLRLLRRKKTQGLP